jgi:hypothetical protein
MITTYVYNVESTLDQSVYNCFKHVHRSNHKTSLLKYQASPQIVSIKEAWTDSRGNIWYQARLNVDWTAQVLYELGKISDSGDLNYRIRYRL